MKTGDLVTIWMGKGLNSKGIILDCLEGSDGFYSYEVLFDGMIEWFSDLELRAFNEGR